MLIIRERPIRDHLAMLVYTQMNGEASRDPKLKPLAVFGAIETLEGDAPDGLVLLEFPTVEDAKAWYDSPQYQAALPYLELSAEHRAVIVQGL